MDIEDIVYVEDLTNLNNEELLEVAYNSEYEDILVELSKLHQEDIDLGLSYNSCTPKNILEDIYLNYKLNNSDIKQGILENLSQNYTTPSSILDEMYHSNYNDTIFKNIAANPAISEKLMEEISNSKDIDLLKCLAENHNLDSKILEKLSKLDDKQLNILILSNQNCTENIFREFSKYGNDSELRERVANDWRTPKTILEKMSYDEDSRIQCLVSSNSSTPTFVLENLMESNSYSIFDSLSKNYNCPESVLSYISQNTKEEKLMLNVVKHNNCPKEILLEQMSGNFTYFLKMEICSNKNFPIENLINQINSVDFSKDGFAENIKRNIIRRSGEESLINILQNNEFDQKIMKVLTSLNNENILNAISKNEHLSVSNIIKLVELNNDVINLNLINNPFFDKLPNGVKDELLIQIKPQLLEQNIEQNNDKSFAESFNNEIIKDNPDIKVLYQMAENKDTPIEILEKLSKIDHLAIQESLASNPNTPSYILDELIKVSDTNVNLAMSVNPNVQPNTLESLSQYNDFLVKLNILDHKNITKEIVEKLCEDKEDHISSKALEVLASFEHNLKETINEASNYSNSNENESTNSNKHKHR